MQATHNGRGDAAVAEAAAKADAKAQTDAKAADAKAQTDAKAADAKAQTETDAKAADAKAQTAASAATPQADAKAETETDAKAAAPSLDLDAAVAEEEIAQARRVYKDYSKRFLMSTGTLAVVQREIRSDGTLGPYEGAIIRVNAKTRTESRKSFDLAEIREWRKLMRDSGIRVLGD